MRKSRLLFLSFLFFIILIAFYFVSAAFWDMRWFDSSMHFLGGLSIGLFSLWVWFVSGLFGRNTPSKKEVFVAALVFSMLAGIWWEFFEFANGIARPIGSYPLDTFNDVLADFIGGIVAGVWGGLRSFYE
ncbi:MAG: seg [Parcubacteria group bacterium]|nr:seg [Parcubacteria group bacterium]